MKEIYDQLWQDSYPLLQSRQITIDDFINHPKDTRRGLTLLYRPPAIVKEAVQAFLEEVQSIEPHQYYYPNSDLHLTVLSIISCYPGFTLDQIDLAEYKTVLEQVITKQPSFGIQFQGITASSSSILIQGFDTGGQLNHLRDTLRNQFKASSLQHSIDQRYTIQTAHLTAMRFTKALESSKLIPLLEKFRTTDFATGEVGELELVFNDWYQRVDLVQSLATFRLL